MSDELIEKVFDPFFTTKPLGQGTGLGLSMVYGFVRQSGGQVRVRSQVGLGTCVELYLPTTEGPPAAPSNVASAAPRGEGERVLVVEDDPAVRMLIREVLEELHYQAVEFADPLLALPYLKSEERIDLMISDVGLPTMNGRELAETARAYRPDLPILFITGYSENAAIRSSFLGSNMSMVTKPFSLDELAVQVREMIAHPE
jgi:CheY-like chemotaxis protein